MGRREEPLIVIPTNMRKSSRSSFWVNLEDLGDLHVHLKGIETLNLKHMTWFILYFTAVDDGVHMKKNRDLHRSVPYDRVLK